MALLTREQIKATNDIETRTVEVPEWGGSVTVRSMTGKQRDAFEASFVQRTGKKTRVELHDIRAKLVAECAVDEHGNRLFTLDDVIWLTEKSAAALERLAEAARDVSGMTDDDLEELQKNSNGQSEGSTSA